MSKLWICGTSFSARDDAHHGGGVRAECWCGGRSVAADSDLALRSKPDCVIGSRRGSLPTSRSPDVSVVCNLSRRSYSAFGNVGRGRPHSACSDHRTWVWLRDVGVQLIMPAGLAFGDVKLSLLLGLFLGWVAGNGIDAARLVIWALLLGNILGILSGVLVGMGRRIFGNDFLPDPDFPPPDDGSFLPLMKTAFPFGPALALSAFAIVVFSGQLITGGILA